MAGTFDPAAVRRNHDDFYYTQARAALDADGAPNIAFWCNVAGHVALAHLVGAADEPEWHIEELLATTRDVLRRAAHVPGGSASTDAMYSQHRGFVALALVDWIASGEPQPDTMGTAHDVFQRYLTSYYGKKKLQHQSILSAIGMACAAERFADGGALIDVHLTNKKLDPKKARNEAELCLALQTGADDAVAARFLRARLSRLLGAGQYLNATLSFYLAKVAGMAGVPRELLARAPEFVGHLRGRRRPKSLEALDPNPAARAPRSNPRPARAYTSTELCEVRHETASWKPIHDEWALFTRRPPRAEAAELVLARAGEIIEWSADRALSTAAIPGGDIGRFRRLRRASPDGATLSAWARHHDELPLEVAFAPVSTIYVADRRVVSTPASTGAKKDWKDALAVGALTRLRALSLNTQESAKARAKRGDSAPYPTVPAWLASSPLAGQLEALELYTDPHDLAGALRLFDVLPNLDELVLWFSSETTACFWCERGGRVRIQTCGLGSESPLHQRRWDWLLKTVLTESAASWIQAADVTTLDQPGIERVQEALAPFLMVDTVELGPLREL